MKLPIISPLGLAIPACIALATPAFAIVTMNYVTVGDAGNAADSTGFGAVSYAYNIGKYEVTNAQYAEFLNAKGASNSNNIYNVNMAGYGITQSGESGSYIYGVDETLANKPVVYVSFYDAARFVNWLLNGQGSGDMETGAYTFTETGIIANAGAQIYLPSEDEWYKAAYYNGDNGTYSLYPNGQNSISTLEANYGGSALTDVGTYAGDPSFYGTFDQGGNAWEWTDTATPDGQVLRGGASASSSFDLRSTTREAFFAPDGGVDGGAEDVGFRVVSVPEPSAMVLTVLFSVGMLTRRKR